MMKTYIHYGCHEFEREKFVMPVLENTTINQRAACGRLTLTQSMDGRIGV